MKLVIHNSTIANFLFIIVFSFSFLSSAYAKQENDKALTPVKLQLKWKHQFQFAGYYAAIEKGFYKEAGIAVEMIEATEGIDPAESVFDGSAEFGVGTTDIILMRSQGKKAVVLASIFQHSAQILVASKKAGIEHIHNLIGKKIDFEPHAADLISYLNDEGISLDQCIISKHLFNINRLINEDVDAMTAYSTDEPFLLNEANFDYVIISPKMGGIDFYGDILFTSEELLKEKPELTDSFLKASLKGWEYALDHQEEMIDLILTKYSSRHSKEHLLFEAQHMEQLIMPDVVEIGYSNPGRWEQIAETYFETKMTPNLVSVKGLLYTDYINKETNLPWKTIFIFILTLLIITSVAVFYFYSSQKLKDEITKRKEIQETLIESGTHFSMLMQQSPSVIEIYNLEGLQVSVNAAYEKLWGFPASHTLKKFNVLKSKEVEEKGLLEYVKKAYNGEVAKVPEYQFDPTGETEAKGVGRVRWLSTKIYPLKTSKGDVRNIVITHEDISERKEAEIEIQKQHERLEELVKERTKDLEEKNSELEGFNKLFIDREFRVQELKDKINKLEETIKKQSR